MGFDGNFTGKIADELSSAVGSHIDKIYQPSGEEIIILLRKKDFARRLIISAKSGMSRVHFTNTRPENPEKPPMFCMLLRKYFSGARLTGVSQSGFERLITFCFEATSEMGDRVTRRIVAELIGNSSNIILVDEDGRIIDAVRRSDILTKKRMLQPGAVYTLPDGQSKLDIRTADISQILSGITENAEMPLPKALLAILGGASPLIAREISFRAGYEDTPVKDIPDLSAVGEQIKLYKTAVCSASCPFMLLKDENPVDFSYFEILQYGSAYQKKTYETYSELLDAFYAQRALGQEQSRITGEVTRLVTGLIARAQKRLKNRRIELEDCKNREILRINGELIKANISLIPPGATSVRVRNFYDPELRETTIKLDPALNPQNNAARYFKEYKKKSVAAVTLAGLITSDEAETEYLETVLDSLSRCRTTAELREIKEELRLSGYIKSGRAEKRRKSAPAALETYESVEGYKIIVGRNNMQNDMITTGMASKNDVWFHTKNIHGAHVVVFSGGGELSRETVEFAARLAARNSKAAHSSNVPVDYTSIKYVKKPSGAKPGMVIYTSNQTVFVTP